MGELNEQEYDMTKKMLDTLRNRSSQLNTTKISLDENYIHQNKSTQGNSTKVLLDEHDMTKKMLDTIRGGCKLLTEAIPSQEISDGSQNTPDLGQSQATEIEPEGQVQGAFQEREGGEDIESIDPSFYKQVRVWLTDKMPGMLEISSMKLFRDESDVELIGRIQIGTGTIDFSMSVTNGLQKSETKMPANNDVSAVENRLIGANANFQNAVKEKIYTDYRKKDE